MCCRKKDLGSVYQRWGGLEFFLMPLHDGFTFTEQTITSWNLNERDEHVEQANGSCKELIPRLPSMETSISIFGMQPNIILETGDSKFLKPEIIIFGEKTITRIYWFAQSLDHFAKIVHISVNKKVICKILEGWNSL